MVFELLVLSQSHLGFESLLTDLTLDSISGGLLYLRAVTFSNVSTRVTS